MRGSAVEEMTKSTGKLLPPGSGEGSLMNTLTPGILPDLPRASKKMCWVSRFRSLQGFITMPENPKVGLVIWKVFAFSGNVLNISLTFCV